MKTTTCTSIFRRVPSWKSRSPDGTHSLQAVFAERPQRHRLFSLDLRIYRKHSPGAESPGCTLQRPFEKMHIMRPLSQRHVCAVRLLCRGTGSKSAPTLRKKRRNLVKIGSDFYLSIRAKLWYTGSKPVYHFLCFRASQSRRFDGLPLP